MRHQRVFCGALIAFACFAAVSAFSADSVSLSVEDAEFPEGCSNPFAEPRAFLDFYDSTIAKIAVDRGPVTNGVAELFAVSELSRDLLTTVPNFSEESPIDRLLKTQLCLFEDIYKRSLKPGVRSTHALSSSNPLLHDHLLKVSPRLFEDSVKLMEKIYAERALKASNEGKAREHLKRIEKARTLGRKKVDARL